MAIKDGEGEAQRLVREGMRSWTNVISFQLVQFVLQNSKRAELASTRCSPPPTATRSSHGGLGSTEAFGTDTGFSAPLHSDRSRDRTDEYPCRMAFRKSDVDGSPPLSFDHRTTICTSYFLSAERYQPTENPTAPHDLLAPSPSHSPR